MLNGRIHLLKIAGIVVVSATALLAGDFAIPAEGPVPFRRDRVPLDTDSMAELSRQLVQLATALDTEGAQGRRGVAQTLALSLALDPANAAARTLLQGFAKGDHESASDENSRKLAISRIWQSIAWLEAPGAGESGHALAVCLKDIAAIADPAEDGAVPVEKGAWIGWIPALASYEPLEKPTPDNPAVSSRAASGPLLAAAKVTVPLWTREGSGELEKWSLKLNPLAMDAVKIEGTSDGAVSPFSLVIGNKDDAGFLAPTTQSLLKLLGKQHGPLPPGVRVTIGGKLFDISVSSKNSQQISAAAAVLASAAITGKVPDATIIGLVDDDGYFSLPPMFWDQLQSLGPGNGGRLILPAAAADILPSMLAFEKPRFFIDYEVMLASNFQELLALTAKPPGEPLASVMTRFHEVREKATPQTLGSYVSNSFVRRRLAELSQDAPYHFSAKMLAIQGAGNRPLTIPRSILVLEIRRAIAPMEWLLKSSPTTYEPTELERIGRTYEATRAAVDGLVRYAEKEDREMLSHVQDLVTAIRTLDRARRARPSAYDLKTPVSVAHADLLKLYASVQVELARSVGSN